jgi:hypothetical protein
MTVTYGGERAINVTVLSPTVAVMQSPRLNATGYVNLSFVSPDGGWSVAVDGMYYTEDCPLEGTASTWLRLCQHGHSLSSVFFYRALAHILYRLVGSWFGLPSVSRRRRLPRRVSHLAATRLVSVSSIFFQFCFLRGQR